MAFGDSSPNQGYAFEDFNDLSDNFKKLSLADFAKRLMQTPQQAAGAQAAKVPAMGAPADVMGQPGGAPAAQASPVAKAVAGGQGMGGIGTEDTFQNLVHAQQLAAAQSAPHDPEAAGPPLPKPPAVSATPPARPMATPAMGQRPMTSRGPALGPYPQGIPHTAPTTPRPGATPLTAPDGSMPPAAGNQNLAKGGFGQMPEDMPSKFNWASLFNMFKNAGVRPAQAQSGQLTPPQGWMGQ